MDSQTTIEEMKDLIGKFMDARGWNAHNSASRDIAISISLEASELLEHYQWSQEGDGDMAEIRNELADVMIYCLRFALLNNIDISEAIREKMVLNAKKYPVPESAETGKK